MKKTKTKQLKQENSPSDGQLPNASISTPSDNLDSTPVEAVDLPSAQAGFPIVGIGASAGGLSAFEAFFSGMPADVDPGMAFVLVQHLAPDHKSILTDLIQRYTRMQVSEVTDGMAVQPNCAYIIPPNRDMAFLNGTLQLMEPSAPRGQRLPIDFFFRSLAQDQHERAICIILSGTGSDGTLGLRAIKGEGGMAMAQTPETAEYDGMPRSAISTGLVDYELPPVEMASQLIAYAAHAFGRPSKTGISQSPTAEGTLKKIFVLLRNQTGHDFSRYKPTTIQRRIERRLAVHQIKTIEEYVKYLQQTPAEVDALFRDMLIGVTNFFRDPDAFKVLEDQIIPKLLAGKSADTVIRIWVPGCSTGEEAFSIAILLAERQEAMRQSFKVQIFATDIDSQAIATARHGLYPASITADISAVRLARFFTIESDKTAYRIHKGIRDMLVFSEQNVIKDPPFSKLDMISCRNLLIYMGGDLQKKLIPLFHYTLNTGGFLFLGTSETIGDFADLFSPLDRKSKVYQRKDDFLNIRRDIPGVFLPPMTAIDVALPWPNEKLQLSVRLPLRELTEKALLQKASPSGVLVNNNGDILYFHGRTGKYLEPPLGEAGVSNILKMAREGLRQELTVALHKATRLKDTVRHQGLRVKTNGDFTMVNLTIHPIETTEILLYLIILDEASLTPAFREAPESSETEPLFDFAEMGSFAGQSDTNARILDLQQQLRAKEEYLQTANEELETSNEELKSSNEEMQSVNEELQSTNEELETSKEELQSVNEELATVNNELQTKVSDLSRVNDDMNNLLSGTGIATVYVDYQLRIMRFTPTATRIINLILSDVGRPVAHIVSNLVDYDSLVEDVQEVLENLIAKEVDVQTKEGKWYAMRLIPYRTTSNMIEGVVITFVDITEMKKTVMKMSAREERYRFMLAWSPNAIVVHRSSKIIYANTEAIKMFGATSLKDLLYGPILDRVHPDYHQTVLARVQEMTNEGASMPKIELKYIKLDGTIIDGEAQDTSILYDGLPAILVAIRNITEQKQTEEALRKANELLRISGLVNNSK